MDSQLFAKSLFLSPLLKRMVDAPEGPAMDHSRLSDDPSGSVPVRREAGVEVRIYSGASGCLSSTTRNHVPVTMTVETMFIYQSGSTIIEIWSGYHPPSNRCTCKTQACTNQHYEAESKNKGAINRDSDRRRCVRINSRRNF